MVEAQLPAAQVEGVSEQTQPVPVIYSPPAVSGSSVDLQSALISVYEQTNPAVVFIITRTGTGSGFVFDLDGHIVTNNHVVSGSSEFEVVFSNGDRQRATRVGTDPDSDLAVIKVESLPSDVIPLRLAQFEDIQVGQIALAIGNPFGEQGSMSMGIISGVGRSLPSQRSAGAGSTYTLPEVLQTDAPINPGNSGGPLLNLDGEVIGVNSAIATDTGTNSGVGFAIPVSAVQKIIPQLIEHGEYTYSYMGVGFDDEVSLNEQALYGVAQTQGAYVLNVSPGSPADKAGLISADPSTGQGGDLIIAVDGTPVKNFAELNSYLVFHSSPGQTVELTVLRPDGEVSLLLTLGARP
jgi:2-alkenal reductase